jgi:2'-5' RNA ligase
VSDPVRRTAITLMLDEAAPAVAAARAELDPVGARRIGLHITVLFPFVARDEVTPALVARLRAFFAVKRVSEFVLARVEEFPKVVAYAAPEPDAELIELTRAVWAEFPDLPPYDGSIEEPVPHATIVSYARVDLGLEQIRARVGPALPARCAPAAASLLEEYEPDLWRELEPLPFRVAP